MKRYFKFIAVGLALVLSLGAASAQDASTVVITPPVSAGTAVTVLDPAILRLASDLDGKLVQVKADKITVGQFTFRSVVPSLSNYLNNQLTFELINIPTRTYTILSSGSTGADWTISGEILEMGTVIRLYVRLIRANNRAVEAAFHVDFERTTALMQMLSATATPATRRDSSVSSAPHDPYDNDTRENPLLYDLGTDTNAPLINRHLREGSEHFYLLVPETSGRLTAETTGDTDTFIEFYDYDSGVLLVEDDDSGSSLNARIRHVIQAGHRYLVMVRGYNNRTSGAYGFRAFVPRPSV